MLALSLYFKQVLFSVFRCEWLLPGEWTSINWHVLDVSIRCICLFVSVVDAAVFVFTLHLLKYVNKRFIYEVYSHYFYELLRCLYYRCIKVYIFWNCVCWCFLRSNRYGQRVSIVSRKWLLSCCWEFAWIGCAARVYTQRISSGKK